MTRWVSMNREAEKRNYLDLCWKSDVQWKLKYLSGVLFTMNFVSVRGMVNSLFAKS